MGNRSGRFTYNLGVVVACVAAFAQVWIRVVANEDNPANLGFFCVVMAAGACAATARFQADAMPRAMVATAGVQMLVTMLVATAPITAREPMGVTGVLVLGCSCAALWLMSAALFYRNAPTSS